MTSEGGPQVIITGRDLALMNVVGVVFPKCYHLLCRFHIQKNVQAECKMLVNSVDAWDVVLQAWENVMDCEDELKFNDCVNHLELVFQSWPVFFEYVNDSWIIPYKKYFVKAWTNKVIHLGNTTSNRRLVGYVSRSALELLAPKLERVKKIGFDTSRCGCILKQTYGLHVHSEVDLLLNIFKEVDIVGKVTIKHKLLDIVYPSMTSMLPPASKIKTKGGPKSHRSKKSTKRDPSYFEHVDAFIESSRQDTCVAKTENKLKTKGVIQEKIIHMLEQFNLVFQPYIMDFVDVVADGHCGYRCTAALLGIGEESWPLIKHDLYKELSQWRDEYATLVGGYDRLEELRKSLLVHSPSGANLDKLMTIPDMGYAIANRYNVIFVCLSSVQNLTIFSLRTSAPILQSQHRLICIGYVYGSHFVQVRLQEGCPLSMVDIISSSNCYPKAKGWASFYRDRMHAFIDLHVVDRRYVDLMKD
ncbi:uncharacterized protein LOC114194832 [Vigna unguiculata]|uniref:uncharacterized protein LOC114194832 n=1 Tax=Vigna unguiculata TaxID=3917 RepID=UPI001016386D|nr:uncharacterized protein LOC114194832 [Vigna unguiculata]